MGMTPRSLTSTPDVPIQTPDANLPASATKRAKEILDDVDKWTEQLYGVWVRFLKRERGVVVAKLGGSKAREGTKFWSAETPGKLARPITATGVMEVKAFDPKKWIDKTRWLGELGDDTKDVLRRFFVAYFVRSGMEDKAATDLAEALTNERVGDVKDWHEGYLDRLGELAAAASEKEGSTIQDVVAAVEIAFDQAQSHAEAVAMSQMVGSANQAQLEAINALGMKGKKVWFSAMDHRVRDSHRAAHGDKRDFDKAFSVGKAKAAMQYPGDRAAPIGEWINCRCVLLFYPVTDGGEPLTATEAAWAWQGMQMQVSADILEWSERKRAGGAEVGDWEWKDGVRHVRTPEGARYYGVPIGSPIVPGVRLSAPRTPSVRRARTEAERGARTRTERERNLSPHAIATAALAHGNAPGWEIDSTNPNPRIINRRGNAGLSGITWDAAATRFPNGKWRWGVTLDGGADGQQAHRGTTDTAEEAVREVEKRINDRILGQMDATPATSSSTARAALYRMGNQLNSEQLIVLTSLRGWEPVVSPARVRIRINQSNEYITYDGAVTRIGEGDTAQWRWGITSLATANVASDPGQVQTGHVNTPGEAIEMVEGEIIRQTLAEKTRRDNLNDAAAVTVREAMVAERDRLAADSPAHVIAIAEQNAARDALPSLAQQKATPLPDDGSFWHFVTVNSTTNFGDPIQRKDLHPEAIDRIAKMYGGEFGGLQMTVTSAHYYSDTISIEGVVRDKHGDRVGKWEVNIEEKEKWTPDYATKLGTYLRADHGLLTLDANVQGAGLATGWQMQLMQGYMRMGIGEVKTHANISVGGYSWAKAGFGWDPENPPSEVINRLGRAFAFSDGAPDMAFNPDTGVYEEVSRKPKLEYPMSPETRAKAYDIWSRMRNLEVNNPDYPTPQDVASLGLADKYTRPRNKNPMGGGADYYDDTPLASWPGKDILLGSDWYALGKIGPTVMPAGVTET